MVSERKLAANRRNALKSTGPRTDAGKRIVSMNALKHGLCSSRILLTEESREAFEQLLSKLMRELTPQGTVELELLSQIAACACKLWRARAIEDAAVLSGFYQDNSHCPLRNLKDRHESVADLARLARYQYELEIALTKALGKLRRVQSARRDREQTNREQTQAKIPDRTQFSPQIQAPPEAVAI